MGVIRKKTISKGYEGGLKYYCDVCSADITATVSTPLIDSGTMHMLPISIADVIARSASGAILAPHMTSAYLASRKAQAHAITTLPHIHTMSLNSILYPFLILTGGRMKSFVF